MIVRRLFAGLLLTGLAAPALASAPHPRELHPADVVQLPVTSSRVFMRAEAADDAESPAPGPATAASIPSPEIAARARLVFEANRAGKIDRAQYTDEMNGYIDDKALATASAQLTGLGEVKSFNQVRKITQGHTTVYVFRIDFVKGTTIEEAVGWNAAGKVAFLQFTAPR
jgi:hypothetical protein